MRFTLRDLLWLALAVALALSWWNQSAKRSDFEWRLGDVRRHAEALRRELTLAKQNEHAYTEYLSNTQPRPPIEGTAEVNWELADAMIP